MHREKVRYFDKGGKSQECEADTFDTVVHLNRGMSHAMKDIERLLSEEEAINKIKGGARMNPYRDKEGNFTTKEKATYKLVGGVKTLVNQPAPKVEDNRFKRVFVVTEVGDKEVRLTKTGTLDKRYHLAQPALAQARSK